MQLYPTRNAVHVAAAGIAVVAVGLVSSQPAVLAWGGALLVGLSIARAASLLSVARVRAAGFEMLWRESGRSRRVHRGHLVELAAEVRNRDTRAARYVALRAIASPELEVEITPNSGEVPAGGRLAVTLRVRAHRVGRHGLFGLSVEVRGSPGLFEVPLTFANPFGLEVVPSTAGLGLRGARGGRSRMLTEAGRPGRLSGDGAELREIREHRAGDPLKRVAWKASARRGKLLVRDHEQEERDVVWLVLDASVELWAGRPGAAPLDSAIDQVQSVAEAHLRRGDRVGLVVCAARVLSRVLPGRGPRQGATILAALVDATGMLDADRSGLDADDVAARVLEHLRTLDPGTKAGLSLSARSELVRHAASALGRAPFPARPVAASDADDRALRGYLSAFGITSPPRLSPERDHTDATLIGALDQLASDRPRSSLASLVYVWSPAPDPGRRAPFIQALEKIVRRRFEVRWVKLRLDDAEPPARDGVAAAVSHAVFVRATVTETAGERALRRMGVSTLRIRPRRVLRHGAAPESPEVPGDT